MPAETHVERSPMDRQQVFDLIRDRLADILEVEPSSIHEGDSFTDDLEADSLALIELVDFNELYNTDDKAASRKTRRSRRSGLATTLIPG